MTPVRTSSSILGATLGADIVIASVRARYQSITMRPPKRKKPPRFPWAAVLRT